MKNADMPAMPNSVDIESLDLVHGINTVYGAMTYSSGITKREMIAMHCIAQLLPSLRSHSPRECAKLAIEFADALLAELEVENGR